MKQAVETLEIIQLELTENEFQVHVTDVSFWTN